MGCSSSNVTTEMLLHARRTSQQAKTYRGLEADFPCTIPEPHMRGIAIPQLKALLRFAQARCAEEHWLDRDPRKLGVRVKPQEINLYHLVEYIVKPATKFRSVSYVEFASNDAGDQVPKWFVSHYWGERVGDFIVCLDLFRDRHVLSHIEAFWICAYALRQNPPGPEIGTGSPLDEPFAKALRMNQVKGTLMILDQPLAVFSRAWCTFEGTLTLQARKRLDLVVSQSTESTTVAQMIADGPARGDGTPAIQEHRDQSFPLEVAEKGMNISIEDATATKVQDVNRILNCIANGTSGISAPPVRHENYLRYNMAIRKKFAAVVLRVAIATGEATSVRRALRAVPEVNLRWRDARGRTYLQAAKDAAESNPHDQGRKDIADYLYQACSADGGAVAGGAETSPKADPSTPRGTVRCTSAAPGPREESCVCGTIFVDDALFCKICGQRRPTEETCDSCGQIFPKDANFCKGCGERRPVRTGTEDGGGATPSSLPAPVRLDIPFSPAEVHGGGNTGGLGGAGAGAGARLVAGGTGSVRPSAVKGRRPPTPVRPGSKVAAGSPSTAVASPEAPPSGDGANRRRARSNPAKQGARTKEGDDQQPRSLSALAAVGRQASQGTALQKDQREPQYRVKREMKKASADRSQRPTGGGDVADRPHSASPAVGRFDFQAPKDRPTAAPAPFALSKPQF